MTGTKTPLLTATVLAVALAMAGPALAEKPGKHSAAHEAAVQRCTDIYEARVAAAHAPNSPTGKARKQTMHAAAEAKKACVAKAPK